MTKKHLIAKIQNGLKANHLIIGEDTFNDCPIHKTLGNYETIFIETIYYNGCVCGHYGHGVWIGAIKLDYNEVSLENLKLILENIHQANGFLDNY
jgi:hypothetical protein